MDFVAEFRGSFVMHSEPACFPFIQIPVRNFTYVGGSCLSEVYCAGRVVPLLTIRTSYHWLGTVRRGHGRIDGGG